MSNEILLIKSKWNAAIDHLCQNVREFVNDPGHDFTRARKISFRDVITFLLSLYNLF